jgi:hypothetical protein
MHSSTFFQEFSSGNTSIVTIGGATSVNVGTSLVPTNTGIFYVINCIGGSLNACVLTSIANYLTSSTVVASSLRTGFAGSSMIWHPGTREFMIHGGLAQSVYSALGYSFYIPTLDMSLWVANPSTALATTVIPVQWRPSNPLTFNLAFHTMTIVNVSSSNTVYAIRLGGTNNVNNVSFGHMEAMILYSGNWVTLFQPSQTSTARSSSSSAIGTTAALYATPGSFQNSPSALSGDAVAGITLGVLIPILLIMGGGGYYAYRVRPELFQSAGKGVAYVQNIYINLTTKKFKNTTVNGSKRAL